MKQNVQRMCVFMLDLNECHDQRDICEPNGLQCDNTIGSYSCQCKPGYENKDGSNKCTGKHAHYHSCRIHVLSDVDTCKRECTFCILSSAEVAASAEGHECRQ